MILFKQLTVRYILFGVLLSQVGQWDTDHGCKRLKDVPQMQGIYRKYGLNPAVDYPPCEGFWGINKVARPSTIEWFDRFQTRETLGGGYAGYIENPNEIFTISSRALKENYSEIITQGQSYYYFKFKLKNIPDDLIFEYGEAMPWFDEIGGAIQIKSSTGFHLLSNNIDIIEKWSLINGQWTRIL